MRLSRRLHSELKYTTMGNGKRRARRVAAEAHVRWTAGIQTTYQLERDALMETRQRKDPFLAGVLSFVVLGAGQMYVGDIGRGIAFLIGGIVGYIAFIIPGICVHIWAIIDANALAKINNDSIDDNQRAVEERDKSLMRASDFNEKMIKLYKLFKSELISESEFQEKKSLLISTLATKTIDVDPDDFLASIITLKEQNILTLEEIGKIKVLLM
jgi:TM2 domain-containing membrane protein YozV